MPYVIIASLIPKPCHIRRLVGGESMRKNAYASVAITLFVLMALPTLSLLYATPTVNAVHGHPMIPVPPGSKAAEAAKSNKICYLPAGQCWGSINWAGYALTAPMGALLAPGSVTYVQASWTVPALVGHNLGGQTGSACEDVDGAYFDVATWIGIDGWFGSSTVEQTGTSSDCAWGTAQYYAWYEFYPGPSNTVFPVSAGDKIFASVTYDPVGLTFTTYIHDITAKLSYTEVVAASTVTGAVEGSAEWITEAAAFATSAGFQILSLSDFGTFTFTGAYATIDSYFGSISALPKDLPMTVQDQFSLMINFNFPFTPGIKAQPLALAAAGSSFTVDFVTAGPV
jgi:hypothetical protein